MCYLRIQVALLISGEREQSICLYNNAQTEWKVRNEYGKEEIDQQRYRLKSSLLCYLQAQTRKRKNQTISILQEHLAVPLKPS